MLQHDIVEGKNIEKILSNSAELAVVNKEFSDKLIERRDKDEHLQEIGDILINAAEVFFC